MATFIISILLMKGFPIHQVCQYTCCTINV